MDKTTVSGITKDFTEWYEARTFFEEPFYRRDDIVEIITNFVYDRPVFGEFFCEHYKELSRFIEAMVRAQQGDSDDREQSINDYWYRAWEHYGHVIGGLRAAESMFGNKQDISDDIPQSRNDSQQNDLSSQTEASDEADSFPDDIITLNVAVQKFIVSRSTLKRRIKTGAIKSYRPKNAPPNSPQFVSYSEVANIYPKKLSGKPSIGP